MVRHGQARRARARAGGALCARRIPKFRPIWRSPARKATRPSPPTRRSTRRGARRSTGCGRASPPRRGASRWARRSAQLADRFSRLDRRSCAAAACAGGGGGGAAGHAASRGDRRAGVGARRRADLSNRRRRADHRRRASSSWSGSADTATMGDIAALLKRLDAVVIDGPSAGLYRLRLAGHRRRGPQGRDRGSAAVGDGDDRAAWSSEVVMRFIALLLIGLIAVSSADAAPIAPQGADARRSSCRLGQSNGRPSIVPRGPWTSARESPAGPARRPTPDCPKGTIGKWPLCVSVKRRPKCPKNTTGQMARLQAEVGRELLPRGHDR